MYKVLLRRFPQTRGESLQLLQRQRGRVSLVMGGSPGMNIIHRSMHRSVRSRLDGGIPVVVQQRKKNSSCHSIGRRLGAMGASCMQYQYSLSIKDQRRGMFSRKNSNGNVSTCAGDESIDLATSGIDFMHGHLQWNSRTRYCGELGESDVDAEVTVCGWVDRHRNLGGLLFLDIRDHTGVVQVVVDDDASDHVTHVGDRLRNEWVVSISGGVRRRKDPNATMKTGQIEMTAKDIQVLNVVTKSLPFTMSESDESVVIGEELRLRNRVLDLRYVVCMRTTCMFCSVFVGVMYIVMCRRPIVAEKLRLRHEITKSVRRFLEDEHNFIEVETPILTKSTPEGARDYLVPSRIHHGEWYALPQSPQLFKQMLMIAGYDRYYQVGCSFSSFMVLFFTHHSLY